MISLIANGLVLVGIVILSGSLLTVRQIIRRLPLGPSRNSWYAMAGLIALFVLGYLAYCVLFWGQQTQLIDLIVPGIFFLGACFVLLTALLSLRTAMDVMRITILEQESFTDSLTGVFNRRYMRQRLHEEVAKARRYGFDLGVLMLDLDHFKQVNAEAGHQAGDHVLITVGGIILRSLRDSDILTRYGGEEFLVIVPNTAAEDAKNLAERLRASIGATNFHPRADENTESAIRLTVSIGVANYGGKINSEESLIREADKYLYEAREAGRNQVVAAAVDE